jgi:zinc transporter 1
MEHHHFKQSGNNTPKKDLGMLGVLTHILCDAINNLGVIIAAAVMSFTTLGSRFYADPAVSVGIALMILISATPLLNQSGAILLQGAPSAMDAKEVQEDLEMVGLYPNAHLDAGRLTRFTDSRDRVCTRAPYLATR